MWGPAAMSTGGRLGEGIKISSDMSGILASATHLNISLDKNRDELRLRIIRSLHKQGFHIRSGLLVPPNLQDKESLRKLHAEAVRHRVERARPDMHRHEERLLSHIAMGVDIKPKELRPCLVEVRPGTEDEMLFRYARLHWSIPVSAGYGRRLRFVVYDQSNSKLIGIIGLGDPIFSLGPRDKWVGWDLDARKARLKCAMEIFVLGAVPPYSRLLCGKLISMLATSSEVQEAFKRKYVHSTSLISRVPADTRLALLTTTSALGRSSIYNRLSYRGEPLFVSVGFTSGSGDFQFANGIYEDLRKFAVEHCDATAKHRRWGSGFRNRRELIRKALPLLGLSRNLVYHGVRREVFAIPLARNSLAFLRGEHQRLQSYRRSVDDLFDWFRERWLIRRADRDDAFREFNRESYRLWSPE